MSARDNEPYVVSDERLAEIRALVVYDELFGGRMLPASRASSLDLASAIEDLLAERDERGRVST